MPALTLNDIDPDVVVPPNPYPRPRRLPPDAVYTHAHFDATTPYPYHDRLYAPPSPLHLQIQNSSAGFSHFTLPHPSANWQSHIHHNPYPSPQPPQLVHKVWILDCRSCGTFLTNRGMKAVLLLRPNVSLFSTDALPVNCSAYSTNPDALRPPSCRPNTAPSALRTCECLTQTLCCHTCGTAVGYMIVIPCSRCTSSISATNRATNGHRFVFHSGEINASERHHIPDEPGVLSVEYSAPPPPPSSPPPLAPAYPAFFHSTNVAAYRRSPSFVPVQAFQPLQTSSPSPDYVASLQIESPDSAPSSPPSSPDTTSLAPSSPRRSPRPISQSFPHNPIPRTLPEARGTTLEPCPCNLRVGDVLYWHHLTKNGEIPGVEEDPRARIRNKGGALKFIDR